MRNEDGILAVTLCTCFKGGLIGHLPLAALHDPLEPRRFAPEAIREMKPRIAWIISLLVQSWEPRPGVEAPEESLQALGKYLMELGTLSRTDFAELVKIKWIPRLTQYIDYLENSLAAYDYTPEYWAGGVRTNLEATRAFLTGGETAAPSDLQEGRTAEDAEVLCRRLVYRFGELLFWWPLKCI